MIFKYAFNNIKKHKFIIILLISQLLLGLISSYFMMINYLNLSNEIQKTKNMFNNGNVYAIISNWEYYFTNKKFDSVETFSNLSKLEQIEIPHMLNIGLTLKNNDDYFDGVAINDITRTKFNLKLDSGRFFNTEEYTNKSNIQPVILGYNLKNKFSIGDVIPIYGENENTSIKVIGFLSENSYLPQYIGESITAKYKNKLLDDMIIATSSYIANESLYDALIRNSYLFFDENLNNNEVNLLKSKIKKIFFDNGVEINLRHEKIGIDLTINDLLEKKILLEISSIIILIFSGITIILTFINSINIRKKEFGTYLLCGMSKKDFCKIILFELLSIDLIAFLMFVILCSLFGSNINLLLILVNLLIISIYSIIVSIIPICKLKKLTIKDLIKGD